MNTTTNYNLPQWEDSDRVTREDVNGAMSSIDSAISAGAKVIYGSYEGKGATTTVYLYFDWPPKALFLYNNGAGNTAPYALYAIVFPGVSRVFYSDGTDADFTEHIRFPDGARSCVISNSKFGGKQYGFNAAGSTYHYVAVG